MQLRRLCLVAMLASCGSQSVMPAPVAAEPTSFTGIWLGTLHTSKDLRVQIHLDLSTNPAGCTLDSLDQGLTGVACANVVAKGSSIFFEVPSVKGSLTGTLSTDGNTLTATWTQSIPRPLVLTRQATALEAVKVAMDPPMPPVDVDHIKSVMDSDLAKLSASELAPATGIGVTIGVVEHGKQAIFSYGSAKPDSVFEIGSITKTFTGLVLAQMVEQHQVRLDEPVRELLPKGTVAAPASGKEITLVDLSAQVSGLPRLPDNMSFANMENPYADYDAKALYAYIGKHGVAMPAKPEHAYSNLGVGLLGQALADRASTSYEALVEKDITGPLGMHDTAITLTPAMAKRFIEGHGAKHQPAHAWDWISLAGAGAIRSTASDMLVYLQAQLHPESAPGTLAAAIKASHAIQAEAGPGMHIALNWMHVDDTGEYWHNGATGGYTSWAAFDPAKDFAVIVLVNRSIEEGMLADEIGKHVVRRLTGKPAPSLTAIQSAP